MISSVSWSRRDVYILVVLIVALGLTWLPRVRGPIDLRWDAAAYFILGTSLAEGNGYRFSNEPGNLRAVVWPPLLPAIIAAHERLLGTTDPVAVGRWLRLSFFVIWIVYIAGAYVLFRQFGGRMLAALGTILTALHFTTIWLSDRSYSDLPFAVAVVTFVIASARRERWADGMTWIAASAAYMLRTAGMAVLIAWIVDAFITRRPKAIAVRIGLALLPILAWQGWLAYVERTASTAEPSYAYARADYAVYNVSSARNMMLRDPNDPSQGRSTATEIPRRVMRNLRTMLVHLGEATSMNEGDWEAFVTAIKQHRSVSSLVPWRIIPVSLTLIGTCVAFGAIVCFIQGPRIVTLVLAAYIALLALLPSDYHWPRYLAGIAPLVFTCFLCALWTVTRYATHSRRSRWIPAVGRVFAVVMAGSVLGLQIVCAIWHFTSDLRPVRHVWNGKEVRYQLFSYDDAFHSFDSALDWIAARGSSGDIVISSMPHWVYLRTHLQSVMPPFESDVERGRTLIKSVDPRFVVIDQSGWSPTKQFAAPVIARYSNEWILAYRDGAGLVEVYEAQAARSRARR